MKTQCWVVTAIETVDKDNDEYGQLAERQTKALVGSMKQTLEAACNRVEEFKDLTPLQQDFVKLMAVANVTAHFGGFNKKERNGINKRIAHMGLI